MESKWISAKRKLPQKNKWVLVFLKYEEYEVARLVNCTHGQFVGDPKFLQFEIMRTKNMFIDVEECEYWCDIPYPSFCKRTG